MCAGRLAVPDAPHPTVALLSSCGRRLKEQLGSIFCQLLARATDRRQMRDECGGSGMFFAFMLPCTNCIDVFLGAKKKSFYSKVLCCFIVVLGHPWSSAIVAAGFVAVGLGRWHLALGAQGGMFAL